MHSKWTDKTSPMKQLFHAGSCSDCIIQSSTNDLSHTIWQYLPGEVGSVVDHLVSWRVPESISFQTLVIVTYFSLIKNSYKKYWQTCYSTRLFSFMKLETFQLKLKTKGLLFNIPNVENTKRGLNYLVNPFNLLLHTNTSELAAYTFL